MIVFHVAIDSLFKNKYIERIDFRLYAGGSYIRIL